MTVTTNPVRLGAATITVVSTDSAVEAEYVQPGGIVTRLSIAIVP